MSTSFLRSNLALGARKITPARPLESRPAQSLRFAARPPPPPSRYFFSTGWIVRPQRNNGESSSTSSRERSIVGTVPYHTSYTLLQHPKPPSTYPPKLDAAFSPLGRQLMVQAIRIKGGGNFWWDGEEGVLERVDKGGTDEESYPFLFFEASPSVSPAASTPTPLIRSRSGTVTSSQVESLFDSISSTSGSASEDLREAYLLVCTHGSRDCRCGDRGRPLVDALRAELSVRRSADVDGVWRRIRVGEVAHVGGHKYAANLLAFPFGDWLGQLTPEHVPLVLDTVASRLRILDKPKEDRSSDDASELQAPLFTDESIWRGRMGLSKEEQVRLFEKYSSAVKR